MKKQLNEYYLQFKSNKLFKATMKSYFIIACMVFLAYALVMVMNVYHAAITQLTSAEQKMLSQAETTTDFILRDITSNASIVFENNAVAIDAVSKPYTPIRSYEISTLISEMKTRTSAIDKVYFFNLTDNCIYTGDHPVYDKESFPDHELLDIIADSSFYTVNLPHILKYEDGNEIKEERVLLSVFKYSDTSYMAVFVNSDVFNSMVNSDFDNKNQSMTILQSNGLVLSSTEPELFGQNLSEDKLIQKIDKMSAKNGYFNLGGRIYSFRKSNTLNSLYICSFRSSSVIVSYIWQFLVIIIFALLLICLYFISSIKMSMSIFRPFRELRSDVFKVLGISPKNGADDAGTDKDLQLISKNLANIKNEYDAMQERELLYSETKRNELVYNLLTGSFNYDEKELDEYNIRFPHPYSTILLIRLDNTKNIERSNIGLILYGISNAGTELLTQNGMTAYFTTFSNEYDVLFIVNHPAKEFDTAYLTQLQKYVQNAFDITVSVAYDTSDSSPDSASQMYRHVRYAMQYRIVNGHGSIVSYNALINHAANSCEYPAKYEKAVIREINQKNMDGIVHAIDDFIQAVSDMPYIYIIIHTSVLMMAISAHITPDRNSSEHNYEISDDIMRVETIDEIRSMLITKCNDVIISSSDIETNDKHLMIANSIEEYINEHYADPNLSIDVIASYVNKSANYTRSIFKQNKGISISEYITRRRFDEVCRMLIETNLTAQAIGQKAGMSSGSYFYTAFKKYTGYTPEQYRKKHMTK